MCHLPAGLWRLCQVLEEELACSSVWVTLLWRVVSAVGEVEVSGAKGLCLLNTTWHISKPRLCFYQMELGVVSALWMPLLWRLSGLPRSAYRIQSFLTLIHAVTNVLPDCGCMCFKTQITLWTSCLNAFFVQIRQSMADLHDPQWLDLNLLAGLISCSFQNSSYPGLYIFPMEVLPLPLRGMCLTISIYPSSANSSKNLFIGSMCSCGQPIMASLSWCVNYASLPYCS